MNLINFFFDYGNCFILMWARRTSEVVFGIACLCVCFLYLRVEDDDVIGRCIFVFVCQSVVKQWDAGVERERLTVVN